MRIISYFTPDYAPTALGLFDDCLALDLPHSIVAVPDLGSWRLNCGRKAEFIAAEIARGESVLWLDADARIRGQLPEPEGCDFACWFIPAIHMQRRDQGRHASYGIAAGTMYFNATDPARDLVARWVERERMREYAYEQIVLSDVWHLDRPAALRTRALDQGHCKVFDAPWFEGEHTLRVEHMQASRRLRKR